MCIRDRVVDASEELRDREETSLEQLMAGSRILVGAVSHEVRNVCGAISIIYENLARDGSLSASKDFEALGSLVQTCLLYTSAARPRWRWRPSGFAGAIRAYAAAHGDNRKPPRETRR